MIVERFQLVITCGNINYTEDEEYIRYFVAMIKERVNQKLRIYSVSKSEIYEMLGFEYGESYDPIYASITRCQWEKHCSSIDIYLEKVYTIEFGKAYLINVEVKDSE